MAAKVKQARSLHLTIRLSSAPVLEIAADEDLTTVRSASAWRRSLSGPPAEALMAEIIAKLKVAFGRTESIEIRVKKNRILFEGEDA